MEKPHSTGDAERALPALTIPAPDADHPLFQDYPPPHTVPAWSLERAAYFIRKHTTFFRVHLLAFTFVPLIFSGIFFASNGEFKISFLDSMFLCYSAMTVTGLSTVNLSTLTTWQQFILYFLMTIGDITTVSWVMVLIRKRFFRTHCEYIVGKQRKNHRSRRWGPRLNVSSPIAVFKSGIPSHRQPKHQPKRKDAVNTSEGAANGNGNGNSNGYGILSPMSDVSMTTGRSATSPTPSAPGFNIISATPHGSVQNTLLIDPNAPTRRSMGDIPEESPALLSPTDGPLRTSPQSAPIDLPPMEAVEGALGAGAGGLAALDLVASPTSNVSQRAPAVEFAATTTFSPRMYANNPQNINVRRIQSKPSLSNVSQRGMTMLVNKRSMRSMSTYYGNPNSPGAQSQFSTKYQGLGGFPGPSALATQVIRITAPHAYSRIERKMSMPLMRTLDEEKTPWLKFSGLIVGRNSDFRTETLSDEQLEDLGGAEYRALRWLSYLVPVYFIGCQLISVLIFLPQFVQSTEYDALFAGQFKQVSKVWFGFFQVMGAYTGGGLSLVDQGMVPFQSAYLMIFALVFVILAGNHALPIFLRLMIWVASKIVKPESDADQAFSFLLDHPRRCFLYLFPSPQTWFLVICLIFFSLVEWAAYLALNVGIPAYQSIPAAPRVIAGLFQGLAARASGLSIVPIASFAPALQFLYVVMMYIAIYPIALSIRSTNVYEERSLGVFEVEPEDEDEPDDLSKLESRSERIGRYVGWHLRKQMSVDIWWLVWAVFLVAIFERGNLMNDDKKWFDLFRVLFELVSAFGGIGFSLGVPFDNFSFSGAVSPASKLVIIVIMVRGRHRGLPVAIDRAVLLPSELVTHKQDPRSEGGRSSGNPPLPPNSGASQLAP